MPLWHWWGGRQVPRLTWGSGLGTLTSHLRLLLSLLPIVVLRHQKTPEVTESVSLWQVGLLSLLPIVVQPQWLSKLSHFLLLPHLTAAVHFTFFSQNLHNFPFSSFSVTVWLLSAAAALLEIEIIINEAKLSNLSLEMMKFQWFTQMPTAAIKTCVLRQLSTIDTGIVQKCWYYFPSKESHMSLTQETPRLQLRRLFNIWLQHFWRVISKKRNKFMKLYKSI